MEASLRIWAEWRGAGLDRLLDEGHAALVGAIAQLLRSRGWIVQFEVTFDSFGDRGSIDVLAWHEQSRTLLVVEVKTELASLDGLLRPLDVKVRVAPAVARDRYGWKSSSVGRLVVLPEDRTARRAVVRHGSVLDLALPAGNRLVRRWLAHPAAPLSGLVFLTSTLPVGTKRNPSAVQRVRGSRRA